MTVLVVLLLVVGLALLAAEAHVPSFGLIGVTGIGAVGAALVLAIASAGSSLALALAVTVPVVAATGGAGAVALRKGLAAQKRRARLGTQGMIGHIGVVRRPLDPLGQVLVDGELWRARRSLADEDERPPEAGEHVVVDRIQGLTLSVRRAELWEVEG